MAHFFFAACTAAAVVAFGTAAAPADPSGTQQQTPPEGSVSVDANAAAWTAYAKPGGKPSPPPAAAHPYSMQQTPPAPPAAFRFASSQGDNMVLQMARRRSTRAVPRGSLHEGRSTGGRRSF